MRCDRSARSSLLLLLLEKRGAHGDDLLNYIMKNPILKQKRDQQARTSDGAPSEPPISRQDDGSPALPNRQLSRSLVLSGDVETDSQTSGNSSRHTSNEIPKSIRDGRHTTLDVPTLSNSQISNRNGLQTGDVGVQASNGGAYPLPKVSPTRQRSRTVTQPDGAISSEVIQRDHPGHVDEPTPATNPVAVPSGRTFGDVDRSSIAIPSQQTGVSHIPQAVFHQEKVPQSSSEQLQRETEEPQVSRKLL